MDLKKYEKIILCCVTVLGIFSVGFFIGRDTGKNEIIITTSGTPANTGTTANTVTSAADGTSAGTGGQTSPVPSPDESEAPAETQGSSKLNINTATADDLQALPGIGEVLAERIVEYRTQNGDFESVDDLRKVSGIGEAKLSNIKPYITN